MEDREGELTLRQAANIRMGQPADYDPNDPHERFRQATHAGARQIFKAFNELKREAVRAGMSLEEICGVQDLSELL